MTPRSLALSVMGSVLLFAAQARSDDADMQPEHAHHHDAANQEARSATHVPPAPPAQQMPQMSYQAMKDMMQMDDTQPLGKVMLDQLEWRDSQRQGTAAWEAQGWFGGDYNKLWFKTEGEYSNDYLEDARAELLWDRAISRWWDLQAGVRQDFGAGPARTWVALGVQGLAPYWLDVEATVYFGEQGRTAARLKVEHDLLLTQRLILQPEAKVNLYGKTDRERAIGSGLSDLEIGLRLRYEIRREFAPYAGVTWHRRFGTTADLVRAAGESANELQFVVGLKIWF